MMWEGALEKLKVLNYEIGYCDAKGKKPFNRVHFVFPTPNVSQQFDDFVSICEWLFFEITKDAQLFRRDQLDDPNTVANKMMLALRQVDFRLSFPAQKLRQANGENVCSVLEFLTDKALEVRKFKWGLPIYIDTDKVEQTAAPEESEDAAEEQIQDDIAEDAEVEDTLMNDPHPLDLNESQLDGSTRQILHGQIDPVEWKIELERVSQKLKTNQVTSTNEWRAHVDQTVSSKESIDRLLSDTRSDLNSLNQ